MEDRDIVNLYWARSEQAIAETEKKYGSYCYSIAFHILYDHEDAQEAVNDTYLGAWKGMPPHRPSMLSCFLGKITRRISLDRWKYAAAKKRGGGQVPLALEELSDCVPSGTDVERELEEKELTALLDRFLKTLRDPEQQIFLCRYWYLEPISAISAQFGFTESKVKSMLARTRKKLRAYLEKEGIER